MYGGIHAVKNGRLARSYRTPQSALIGAGNVKDEREQGAMVRMRGWRFLDNGLTRPWYGKRDFGQVLACGHPG
jgi:hypothetical protein